MDKGCHLQPAPLSGTVGRLARGMLHLFGFECPHGQECRNRCTAFSKAMEQKSGIHERAQQIGQGHVGCSNLVSEPLVRPRRLGPMAIEIAGTNDEGLRVSSVDETATEARVNADVNQATARSDNSPRVFRFHSRFLRTRQHSTEHCA